MVTLAVLFTASFYNSLIYHSYALVLLAWIPVIIGLFIFDLPFRNISKSRSDFAVLLVIIIIALIAVTLTPVLLIPYFLFGVSYMTRIPLIKRKKSYITPILGLLGYASLFSLLLPTTLTMKMEAFSAFFIYMLGSEFTVRYFLKKDTIFILYDIVPLFLILLNMRFIGAAVSLLRIPSAIFSKKIKYIGIMESILLAVFTVLFELFIILNFKI